MSRSKINYKIYNGKSLKSFIENIRIYFLSLMFSAGIIIGAICLNDNNSISDSIKSYSESYMILKSGQGISDIFFNSIIANLFFYLLNLFLSFSLIGYPFIFWIPFLKGLGIGTVFGYLYTTYRINGFGYCFLTLFPGLIVSMFSLISACNKGCDYSKNAYLKAINGKGQFEKSETKIFLFGQMIFACICFGSSIIDAVFSFIFLRFFEF